MGAFAGPLRRPNGAAPLVGPTVRRKAWLDDTKAAEAKEMWKKVQEHVGKVDQDHFAHGFAGES